ncbi:MAG: glycosyltransferase N-terminal domain-containing protein [Elusimicrobiota bacterium]
MIVLVLGNLMAPLAALGVVLAFLLSPRRRVLRGLPAELSERFGSLPDEARRALAGRPVLWVHAASAGEVLAVDGLIRTLKAGAAAPAVLLSCTTMAGREAAKRLGAADAAVIAPLDCWPAVTRFLEAAKPYSLILVETELWPNMIAAASRRGLKIGLVNGRLSERSFSRYLLARPLLAPFLRKVCRLAVQGEADGERFRALGAPEGSVLVVGNMKYDRVKVPDTAAAAQRLRALGWDGAPVFVAGSTHPGEEEAVLGAFLSAQARHPALKLVIAPRHAERAADTAASLKERGVTFTSWSASDGAPAGDCLLIDRLGPLASFYPSATVSFVGGTLVPVGGHNVLEPALAGSPVLFGPHTAHTRQAAELLASAGCGHVVSDQAELAARLDDALSFPERTRAQGEQARRLARGLQGATERTLVHLAAVTRPPER